MGDNEALGLDGILNKTLEVAMKSRPDIFSKLFEACMSAGTFPIP